MSLLSVRFEDVRFRAIENIPCRRIDFMLLGRPFGSDNWHQAKLEWDEIPMEFSTTAPSESFRLDFDGSNWAKGLMDDLWRIGVRPTDMPSGLPDLVAAKDKEIARLEDLLKAVLPSALRPPAK